MFSKAVNGTYYVAEAVPDTTKHTTYIVTAYMTKNKPTGVQSADAFSPTLTAKPEADLPVGTQNVPKAAPNVNTEGLETRLSQTVETVCDAAVTPDAVKQAINDNTEIVYPGIQRRRGGFRARWHQPDGGICAHHLRRTAGGKNLLPARWKRCISENYKYFPLAGKNNVEQPGQTSGLLHCILL